jgi:hypothetical protein
MQHRGVEFEVHQVGKDRWNWHIYPRKEISIHISDVVSGDEEAAIAKCRSVIDERLGPPRPQE